MPAVSMRSGIRIGTRSITNHACANSCVTPFLVLSVYCDHAQVTRGERYRRAGAGVGNPGAAVVYRVLALNGQVTGDR